MQKGDLLTSLTLVGGGELKNYYKLPVKIRFILMTKKGEAFKFLTSEKKAMIFFSLHQTPLPLTSAYERSLK